MFDDIIKAGYENQVHNENDYVKDGLLYCGVCGHRKERYIKFLDQPQTKVPVNCICDEERYRKKQEEEEQRRQEERLKRNRIRSLMDVKYDDAKFECFTVRQDNERQYNLCKKYVDSFSKFYEESQGLLFYGDVGTGKSFAAACIANALLDNGISVIMTSFVKVLENIRKGSEEEQEMMSQLLNSSLVIFDDLGSERNTDYSLEKVYNIVDARYRSGKPMILTTNLSLRDMMEEKDIRFKRIYDRIFEVCYPMEFKGTNWRKMQGNERFKKMREFLEA